MQCTLLFRLQPMSRNIATDKLDFAPRCSKLCVAMGWTFLLPNAWSYIQHQHSCLLGCEGSFKGNRPYRGGVRRLLEVATRLYKPEHDLPSLGHGGHQRRKLIHFDPTWSLWHICQSSCCCGGTGALSCRQRLQVFFYNCCSYLFLFWLWFW